MKKRILSTVIFLFFSAAALAAAQGNIYISQIQITGGKGNTNQDFIELFNPNDQPFNLKGYRLVKRAGNNNTDAPIKSWEANVFIPARGFYLWANSGFKTISVKPDAVTSAGLSENSGIAIRLGALNKGAIIDSISWGSAVNGFTNVSKTNPGPEQALVRENLYQNSSGFSFVAGSPRNSSITVREGAAALANAITPELAKNSAKGGQVLGAVSGQPKIVAKSSAIPTEKNILQASPSPVVNNTQANPGVQASQDPKEATQDVETPVKTSFSWGYLGMAIAALALFIFLIKKTFKKGNLGG